MPQRRSPSALAALTLSLTLGATGAQATPLPFAIEAATLDNGLRVVLSPDPACTTASVAVYYDVGSRDEAQGRSGFAHLFEHMMFEGSEHAPKGTFDRLMDRYGNRDANGTTSEDRTNYYETLPSDALPVSLWLEADRMRALAVTPESFENQRLVVLEERRQSYENAPYGMALLRRDALAYSGFYPYAHTAIGEPEDLQRASFSEVLAFHRSYYGPNNAVLAVAGRFDPRATMALIRQYFSAITRITVPPRPSAEAPPIASEIRETLTDALAPQPAFWTVFRTPSRSSPDHYALELLAGALGDGESSILHQSLVREQRLASEIEVTQDTRRGPSLLAFWTVLSASRTLAQTQSALDRALVTVRAEGISEAQLDTAKNRLRASVLFALAHTNHRAQALAEHQLYDGDATLLRTELDRYAAVTRADVQRVAQQFLDPSHRVVLSITPAPSRSAR
ncbi:MAG: pitrilysin family protein [Deltaproteobacteria bacterium]|nr:pitrilysin family protein [Deltaproteobacteria bacterium]